MKNETYSRLRPLWVIAGSGLLVLLIALVLWLPARMRKAESPAAGQVSSDAAENVSSESAGRYGRRIGRRPFSTAAAERSNSATNAAQIVANKLSQFAQNRRDIAQELARRLNVAVPDDFKRFFDAVEAGQWDEIKAMFDMLLAQRKDLSEAELQVYWTLWPTVHETFGVADITQRWPAPQLLEYGKSILDSLRPGMVYVGGTDPGRFIPTLLNETSEGERHIVLTQNAFADKSYLDYVRFLYGDRMPMPTNEDSQMAFQHYVVDAQRRFQHDQEFPNEPKQIRPGEDVRVTDGKVQVGGQTVVMGINEKILQTLMERNPDLSFALEESFPLKSTYANATPLGPIMELRVQDEQNALTAERAAQSIDYWRTTAQRLQSDPEASGSPETMKSYSKLVVSQGNLFADRKLSAEAEQAYRLATELWPASPEAVFGHVQLLMQQARFDEAARAADAAVKAAPENQAFRALEQQVKSQRRN